MWEFRHLKAFITVARLGSFTSAAKVLHISQPALTVQIQQFEEALNIRLFDRDTRSLQLTTLALEYMPSFERLLADYEALSNSVASASRGAHGSIGIACLPSVSATILPLAVTRYRVQHPDVRIAIKDAVAQRVVEMVQSGEVHFGVGTFDADLPGVDYEHLFVDQMLLVFAAAHPFAGVKRVSIRRLMQEDLILTDRQSSIRKMIDRAFSAAGYLPEPAYEVTYISTAFAFARAGLGVAILPASMTNDTEMLGLESRALGDETMVRRIGIVTRTKRSLSPLTEGFLRVLRECCPNLNAGLS
jgi:DNA-binding transcriptional LysR family regulator